MPHYPSLSIFIIIIITSGGEQLYSDPIEVQSIHWSLSLRSSRRWSQLPFHWQYRWVNLRQVSLKLSLCQWWRSIMTPCTGGTLPVYASNCEEGVQQKALFDIETVALRLLYIYLSIYLVASHMMMWDIVWNYCTALVLINDGMDGWMLIMLLYHTDGWMEGWRESSHKYHVTVWLPCFHSIRDEMIYR